MTTEAQAAPSNASTGDTVVSHDLNEKRSLEAVAPEQNHENVEEKAETAAEPDSPTFNEAPNEKAQSGAPLDRTTSSAQKMGKKKIILVMVALCVRNIRTRVSRGEFHAYRKANISRLDGIVSRRFRYGMFPFFCQTAKDFRLMLLQTIISTALPTIADNFHATESGYSWIAASYLLANAACIPLWGKISDIWGRKPIILMANVLFLVGSLICALANNLPMIIAGRAVQGIGGGGIIILANISVSDLFSMRDRPMYYGIFGATWAIAGALGPIVGGAFTTDVTWRWCFYVNCKLLPSMYVFGS